jgi:hypothetical protein
MAYSKGNSPKSADYNSFVGANPVTSAYASSAAATKLVAALLGVGFGDRGYGQTTPAISAVAGGSQMKAVDWANLRTACSNIATYQGTSTASLPPASDFVVGQTVKSTFDWATYIASLDTNRLNTNGGASLTLVSNSASSTRGATWSTTIISEFTATFPSEDAARYFFNTGGTLNVVLAHADTSSPQNQNWNTILAALGTISVGARSTTRSGSSGTPAALGFYNLTTAYQRVFDGTNIGTGAYSANDVLIDALVSSVAGVNGGNGTTVKIRVTLQDEHTNSFSDIVALGTKASMGHKVASSGLLANISSPTWTVTTNW